MGFLDQICKDIAKRQREAIEKWERENEQIFQGFHDEFAKEIKWQWLNTYGRNYERKIIREYFSEGYIVLKISIWKQFLRVLRKLFFLSLQLLLLWIVIFSSIWTIETGEETSIKDIFKASYSAISEGIVMNPMLVNIFIGTFIIALLLPLFVFLYRTYIKKQIVYFYNDSKKVVLKNLLGHREEIYLNDVHALQILKKRVRKWKNSSYYCYELNLVLKNKERRNILNNSQYTWILEQANKIQSYISIPLWDGKDLR